MTQVGSLSSSTADVNDMYHDKRLPKGIHIVGADDESVSKVGGISESEEGILDVQNTGTKTKQEEQEAPWGYIFIQHMSAVNFEKALASRNVGDGFKPKCFIHRTIQYKKKPNGKGVMKEEKPSVSGLVFLQGRTEQLKSFLI